MTSVDTVSAASASVSWTETNLLLLLLLLLSISQSIKQFVRSRKHSRAGQKSPQGTDNYPKIHIIVIIIITQGCISPKG